MMRTRRGQVDDTTDLFIGGTLIILLLLALTFVGCFAKKGSDSAKNDPFEDLGTTLTTVNLARTPFTFEGETQHLGYWLGRFPYEEDQARRTRLRQTLEDTIVSLAAGRASQIVLSYDPDLHYLAQNNPWPTIQLPKDFDPRTLQIPGFTSSRLCEWDFESDRLDNDELTRYSTNGQRDFICQAMALPDAQGQLFYLITITSRGTR